MWKTRGKILTSHSSYRGIQLKLYREPEEASTNAEEGTGQREGYSLLREGRQRSLLILPTEVRITRYGPPLMMYVSDRVCVYTYVPYYVNFTYVFMCHNYRNMGIKLFHL